MMYVTNSKELWGELVERYGQVNGMELYQLKKDLNAISQDNLPLIDYYWSLKRTWEESDDLDPIPMCTCGAFDACSCHLLKRLLDRETQEKLIQLLMGLNNTYDNVRSHVLTMDFMPTLNKVLGLLQKVEKQKQIVDSVEALPESSAYTSAKHEDDYSNSSHKKPRVEDLDEKAKKQHCYQFKKYKAAQAKANKGGHSNQGRGRGGFKTRANNADTASYDDDDYYETAMTPLQEEDCLDQDGDLVSGLVDTITERVLRNISKKFPPNGNCISEASHAYDVSNFMHASSWIIDTGASDHMTANSALLDDICDLDKPILIYLPDGTTKLVHQIGIMHLTEHITLHNVFIMPSFKQNLLSVGTLLKHNNMTVHFFPDECWFQDCSSRKVLAKGRKQVGLYRITEDLVFNRSTKVHSSLSLGLNKCVQSNNCNQNTDVFPLHKRLGHTSINKLKHVPDFQSCNHKSFDCQVCILPKHHALPFHRSFSHASHSFELLHMDVWGPYRIPTLTGAKSILTILDDHTRTTWTYLIQSKHQVPFLIKAFLVYIDTQFSGKVKIIRTDNGTEFIQGPCSKMFTERGILHQNSIAGVPQQNGRVERKHRHLLDTTRALKI
ncbi:uncharacterized protein LOC141628650 [Silene latifolia]|uniref:uncharacterized protein LOC141628650 n=1 Tax=Silene latifolia TaxID=37657 RepID=UPI003D772788